MGYWLNRIVHSRRVRVAALGAIGLLSTGACGGALLANYTVSGISPFYAARIEPPAIQPRPSVAEWAAEKTFAEIDRERDRAELADPWKPEPSGN